VRGVVLPVAVEPDREVVAVLERVPEPGLHRGADPEVERQTNDGRASGGRAGSRGVGGPVVDDDDVDPGVERVDPVDDGRDGSLLVEGGDDRDDPRHTLTAVSSSRRRSTWRARWA